MKNFFLISLLTAFALSSCSSANNGLFAKKSPIEKYGDKLEDAGLKNTPEGQRWLESGESAVKNPVPVQLPYRQNGNFSPDKSQALALAFAVRQGERLAFDFPKKESGGVAMFAELYKQTEPGGISLLQSLDTITATFSFDVPETGTYLLKLQPPLFRSGGYRLSISTGPSLSFPVADKKAYIGSIWGDSRDGGKRNHEGIDIFAPKRTPAVAAADGMIVGVREGGIGGKTVWLRPAGQNVTLYYAHLDAQLVQEGQSVQKGDTVGLVGNTGNAQYTPSHLHFGVYGFGGAIDPLPFVNRAVKTAPAVSQKDLPPYWRLTKDLRSAAGLVAKNTLVIPHAVSTQGYLAELPDGRVVQIPAADVKTATEPVKKNRTVAAAPLLSKPADNAPVLVTIAAGKQVSVLGFYKQWAYVRLAGEEGWLLASTLPG